VAAPAFGTIGTQQQGTTAAPSVAVPASVASGDLIVVSMFVDSTATVSAMPTGFAHAPDSPVAIGAGATSGKHSLNVMWKRATGADSGTYAFTVSSSVYCNGAAIRYTGAVSSGSPWDVTNSAHQDNTGFSTTPAVTVTTTGTDRLLVFAATNWSGGAWTPPTGFTERRDTGDEVCTTDDLAQAAQGSSGSVTATCAAADRMCAWIGALMATSGGGSTPNPRPVQAASQAVKRAAIF
jgi:hypothetical protein